MIVVVFELMRVLYVLIIFRIFVLNVLNWSLYLFFFVGLF